MYIVYMKPSVYALVSFICFCIIHYFNVAMAQYVSNPEYDKEGLADVIHNMIPIWPPEPITPTLLTITIILYTLVRIGFMKIEYIGYFFNILSIILVLRLPAFLVTITPPPGKIGLRKDTCRYRYITNILKASYKEEKFVCVDNLFSAHAAFIVISMMFILTYSTIPIEKIIVVLVSILTLFMLVSERYHYTSDVYISSIISYLVFTVFTFYTS